MKYSTPWIATTFFCDEWLISIDFCVSFSRYKISEIKSAHKGFFSLIHSIIQRKISFHTTESSIMSFTSFSTGGSYIICRDLHFTLKYYHCYRHRNRMINKYIIVTCYNYEVFADYITIFVFIILKFSLFYFVIDHFVCIKLFQPNLFTLFLTEVKLYVSKISAYFNLYWSTIDDSNSCNTTNAIVLQE
jgi:hypothetical protein